MLCKKCGCSCRDTENGSEKGVSQKEIVLHYASRYYERFKIRYAISWGRDLKAVKDICDTQDEETIKRVIDGYVANAKSPSILSFAQYFPTFVLKSTPTPKLARDPRLDMTPEERLRADGWYD